MPNPYHDNANGRFTSGGSGGSGRGRARAGTESRPGEPAHEFLAKHPPVTSKQRTTVTEAAKQHGWTNNTDPANISHRKTDHYERAGTKVHVDYSEAGVPTRASRRNAKGAVTGLVSKGVAAAVGSWLAEPADGGPKAAAADALATHSRSLHGATSTPAPAATTSSAGDQRRTAANHAVTEAAKAMGSATTTADRAKAKAAYDKAKRERRNLQ